jgi:hypothetical protein
MSAVVDQTSMTSLRSKPRTAALTLFLAACALLAVIPAAASAEPEGGGTLHLAFEPESQDFGLQRVNSSAAQASLQLLNDGEATTPVNLDVVGGSGTFWIGNSDCYGRMLSLGESCSVQVYFAPYNASSFNAQLRATGEGGASFTASLSGEGGRPVFTPATDPTNFGSVPVDSAGVVQTIDVTNVGNFPGGAFIAVISGGAIGSFHLLDENCTGILLSPGATCNLVVSFQPLSTGAKTARLSLFGEDDGGTQMILSGVGLEPEEEALELESAEPSAASAVRHPHRGHRTKPRRGRSVHRNRPRRTSLSSRRRVD